jgi:hypothetical protein
VYEALKENMGLNASLFDQFVIYAGNLLQGDLGSSLTCYKGVKVTDLLAQRMLVTLCLALTATVFTVIIALPLGYLAGVKRTVSVEYPYLPRGRLGCRYNSILKRKRAKAHKICDRFIERKRTARKRSVKSTRNSVFYSYGISRDRIISVGTVGSLHTVGNKRQLFFFHSIRKSHSLGRYMYTVAYHLTVGISQKAGCNGASVAMVKRRHGVKKMRVCADSLFFKRSRRRIACHSMTERQGSAYAFCFFYKFSARIKLQSGAYMQSGKP